MRVCVYVIVVMGRSVDDNCGEKQSKVDGREEIIAFPTRRRKQGHARPMMFKVQHTLRRCNRQGDGGKREKREKLGKGKKKKKLGHCH